MTNTQRRVVLYQTVTVSKILPHNLFSAQTTQESLTPNAGNLEYVMSEPSYQ